RPWPRWLGSRAASKCSFPRTRNGSSLVTDWLERHRWMDTIYIQGNVHARLQRRIRTGQPIWPRLEPCVCIHHVPVPATEEEPEQHVQSDLQTSNGFVVVARISALEHFDLGREKHCKPCESRDRSVVLKVVGEIDESEQNQSFLDIDSAPADRCGFCIRSG